MLDQVELLIQQDDLQRAQAVLQCSMEIYDHPRATLLKNQLAL
jgi:hypothetical protein